MSASDTILPGAHRRRACVVAMGGRTLAVDVRETREVMKLDVIGTVPGAPAPLLGVANLDRKSTRLNSSHSQISYAVFCLKKKKKSECSALVFTGLLDFSHASCDEHGLSAFTDIVMVSTG